MDRKICILVLCGVPASGKSTLAERLSDQKHCVATDCSECKVSNLDFFVISYDELIPEEEEKKLVLASTTQQSSDWKLKRNMILHCVDAFLLSITSNEKEILKPVDMDQELWDRFSKILSSQLNSNENSNSAMVIIIDDNMYYSSMRYCYYQLARKYTIGFCQIYVKCSLETALDQNTRRDNRHVDRDVIVGMDQKMEPPDPINNKWEQFSLVVENKTADFQMIAKLIQSAMMEPVQQVEEEDMEVKKESRQICSSNLVHQADQILRQLVSQKMVTEKDENIEKDQLKKLSTRCNEARTSILNGLRSGEILVTVEMEITDSSKHKNSLFYEFMKESFHQHLSDYGVT